jgi:oxygen-dependent protoporphyrinogen oxidase
MPSSTHFIADTNSKTGNKPANKKRIVVIGAGISGLASAFYLIKKAKEENIEIELLVLEGSQEAGGVIKTNRAKNRIVDLGPEAFITIKPYALKLCEELGISEKIINTSPGNRHTNIAWGQKLHPLPDGFMMFAPTRLLPLALSPLFTPLGKLRMGLDLFIPRGSAAKEESLAQFVRRRLGKEALERIAEPLIGAIYGGNPEYLSATCVTPQLVELEKQHGSLIAALGKKKPQDKTAPNSAGPRYAQMVSFDQGMAVLPEALLKHIPEDSLRYNTRVEKLEKIKELKQWRLTCQGQPDILADAVILATPSHQSARLLKDASQKLSLALEQILHTDTTIFNFLYASAQVEDKCKGFGFVVPQKEKRTMRACTFSSLKFAGRSPEGETLIRAASRHSNISHEEQLAKIKADLEYYLDIKAEPLAVHITSYPQAMPQYQVGHKALLAEIENLLSEVQNLALAGNAFSGIGIPDCINSGKLAAGKVFRELYVKSF